MTLTQLVHLLGGVHRFRTVRQEGVRNLVANWQIALEERTTTALRSESVKRRRARQVRPCLPVPCDLMKQKSRRTWSSGFLLV